jgi:hypothetical protein
MDEFAFACLQAAVRLTRDEQIHSLPALRARLSRAGFNDQEITVAIRTWAQYEQGKVAA